MLCHLLAAYLLITSLQLHHSLAALQPAAGPQPPGPAAGAQSGTGGGRGRRWVKKREDTAAPSPVSILVS